MQVLGELMYIKKNSSLLPLPWYHRAALGLENDTTVSLSLVENKTRGNYDIIVTVIEPIVWKKAYRLSFVKSDNTGIVGEIFSNISKNWDIILSESVTQEGGKHHLTSLICEPKVEDLEKELERMKKLYENKKFSFSAKPVFIDIPIVKHTKNNKIKNGSIVKSNWIYKHLTDIPKDKNIKVLVTADTRLRLLRFTLCSNETISVDIEHLAKQGTLKKITERLSKIKNFNILSSLSNKSSVDNAYARFRLVCEIKDKSPEKIYNLINKAIGDLNDKNPLLSISIIGHHFGKNAEKLTYCKSPYDIIAKAPFSLKPHIIEYKKDFPKNKFPVFLSRRFIRNEKVMEVVNRIKKVLEENDCYVVEAFPKKGDRTASDIEVKSKMWLSKAGILLINHHSKLDGKKAISLNLPQEYGFLDGQGKPILVIQEGHDMDISSEWSNFQGVKPTIIPSNEVAFNSENSNSIDNTIIEWLEEIEGTSPNKKYIKTLGNK